MILFVVKYNSAEEITIETMMTGSNDPDIMDRVYKNDNYKKAVTMWLPFMNKRGFLDTLLKEEKVDDIKEE